MNVLVVHAHPVPESYNASLLNATRESLSAQGHATRLVDLNAGDDATADDLASHDALVLVYPTWWGGFPGVLLDWYQRLLSPWIDGDEPQATSPLRSIRFLIAVTTHGSSRLVNNVQGEPGRQLFSRSMAALCAADVDVRWIAQYKIDRADHGIRHAFLQRVKGELQLAPL